MQTSFYIGQGFLTAVYLALTVPGVYRLGDVLKSAASYSVPAPAPPAPVAPAPVAPAPVDETVPTPPTEEVKSKYRHAFLRDPLTGKSFLCTEPLQSAAGGGSGLNANYIRTSLGSLMFFFTVFVLFALVSVAIQSSGTQRAMVGILAVLDIIGLSSAITLYTIVQGQDQICIQSEAELKRLRFSCIYLQVYSILRIFVFLAMLNLQTRTATKMTKIVPF